MERLSRAGEDASLPLLVVTYFVTARALLGELDPMAEGEAEAYHARGLLSDEAFLFALECSGRVGDIDLDSILPADAVARFLEASARVGFRGVAGARPGGLVSLLLLLAGLAELELRGDHSASGLRASLVEDVLSLVPEALRGKGECEDLLASVIEGIVEVEHRLAGA